MVEQPNTMPRPSALTGITRNTVQYNDTIYITLTGISLIVADIARFFDFQDGGRPPCCTRLTHVGTIHEECLLVFFAVQNLVGQGTSQGDSASLQELSHV